MGTVWNSICVSVALPLGLVPTNNVKSEPTGTDCGTKIEMAVIVAGTVLHANQIEGAMETVSKVALCALVLAATIKVLADLWVSRKRATSR